MWSVTRESKLIPSGVEFVGRLAVVETLPKSRKRYSILPVQLPPRRTSAPAPSAQPAFVVWLVNWVLTGLMLAVTKGMPMGQELLLLLLLSLLSSSPPLPSPAVTSSTTTGVPVCVTP